MADFVLLTGPEGFEHINLDLVRRVTQDVAYSRVTLYFDATDSRTLEGNDARILIEAINRRWQKSNAAKVA
jgi:hypothetical protein